MVKIVRRSDIKNDKYYSYKFLGNFSGEYLYEEEFNHALFESDKEKYKKRQLIIDKVDDKKVKKPILYEKIINLKPEEKITYTVQSNYNNKLLTVLGSDNSSTTVNWKYDIINWSITENTLVFREVDRSNNEQYDRTFNINSGEIKGSRKVMLEDRTQNFVNKMIDEEDMGGSAYENKRDRDLDSIIDTSTFINILFDDSGSMDSTLDDLIDMRDNNLKAIIIPYYNNNETLYNERVNVVKFSEASEGPAYTKTEGINSFENSIALGGLRALSENSNVINIMFQDEADNRPLNMFTGGTPPSLGGSVHFLTGGLDLDNKNRAVFFQVEGHGSSPSFKNTLIDLQASLAGTRFENSTDFNYDTTENDAPSAYAELIENALIRVTS